MDVNHVETYPTGSITKTKCLTANKKKKQNQTCRKALDEWQGNSSYYLLQRTSNYSHQDQQILSTIKKDVATIPQSICV